MLTRVASGAFREKNGSTCRKRILKLIFVRVLCSCVYACNYFACAGNIDCVRELSIKFIKN